MLRRCPDFDRSPNPPVQWYYESDKWVSFYEYSYFIETEYQRNTTGKITTLPKPPNFDIDFLQMKEILPNSGVLTNLFTKPRRVLRAIWFWHDNDLSWVPYSPEINALLEASWEKMESTPAEFVLVSEYPRREIKYSDGHFIQFRTTPNANPEGRAVIRGYPGGGKTEKLVKGYTVASSFIEIPKLCQQYLTKYHISITSPLYFTEEIFYSALGILTNSKREISFFAKWLWTSFSNKDTLHDMVYSDGIMLLTQGQPSFCRKRAYENLIRGSPNSINQFKYGVESALRAFSELLTSFGIPRSKNIADLITFVSSLEMTKEKFVESDFLDAMTKQYFGRVPLPRGDTPHLHHLIPFDEAFPFSLLISLGIQLSIEKCRVYADYRKEIPLCTDDCGEEIITRLPIAKLSKDTPTTPPCFKALAPLVFREIRKHYNIDDEDFLLSLGIETMLYQLLFCGELNSYRSVSSHGRSGSVFYYSYDSQYMVKTIKPPEAFTLIKNLYMYYTHITTKNSYLVPLLGLYYIEDGTRAEYICVMKNLFTSPNAVHEIFDLKGSKLDRSTKSENRKPGVPLKDLDLGTRVFPLPTNVLAQIKSQMDSDVFFLSQVMLTMDYSFLVGIHYVDKNTVLPAEPTSTITSTKRISQSQYASTTTTTTKTLLKRLSTVSHSQHSEPEKPPEGYLSIDKQIVYQFGIIDYLVEYDSYKQVETMVKRTRANREDISSVSPSEYSSRFVSYLDSKFWDPSITK